MGIRGLTTYIANRSDYFFEPYELQNTYLVIDGWSLSSQIYIRVARCNCTFGGDYDQFAHSVTQFFSDLLRCNITPIVLLDGGWENKKKATVYTRAREKLSTASTFNPGVQNRLKFFPLLLTDVFKDVLVKLEINFAMCPFEADDCIATIAKILKAPVLSYDSDFYIYGVEYIPFNTLDPYITKNKLGYAKRCKIYRVEKLLDKFKGLDVSLLPLAAILLGNDYINRSTFKHFFSKMKLRKCQNQNEQQRRIKTILNWLTNYSLTTAVAAVLKKLPRDQRPKVLQSIEIIVNGYSLLTTYMLQPLGLTESHTAALNELQKKAFKFHGDLNRLEEAGIEEIEDGRTNLSSDAVEKDDEDDEDEVEEEEEEEGNTDEDFDLLAAEKFAASVPEWFIKSHLAGDFPAYFINMMTHNIYILPSQIEDFSQPTTHEISLPIIHKIFSILSSSKGEENVLQLVIREKKQFVRQFITVPSCSTSLEELRELDLNEKKKIIDDVLGISEEDRFDEIPENWRLYVATIIFWMKREVLPERTNIHLCCVLVSMLFYFIDDKIGFVRSRKTFERKFASEIDKLEKKSREAINQSKSENPGLSLQESIDSVSNEDCIAAGHFLISHFEMDERLRTLPRRFSVEIVHAFAQLQSCFRHIMHLNALLGYPYHHPRTADVYNGTLLYNLYTNFVKRVDVHSYIKIKLEKASSLFKVYQSLQNFVERILVNVPVEKSNPKRKRNRKKKDKMQDDEEFFSAESDSEVPEKNAQFYDPRNPFTLLTDS
uniref:Uncharacterized protein n=1 Tax=Bracon brevicornis TaxID=1563983 RepID=A0A6V7IGD6_9HYME